MTTKFDRPLTIDPTQHKEETTLASLRQTPSAVLQPSKRSHLPSSLKKRTSHLQWFYDLPVRNKQLAGLFASGMISIVGLVGVGAVSTVSNGRNQLFNQAKSELAVTKSYYDIKINQMGFGFRGQSDNAAIVAAAQSHAQGQALSPTTEEQVKQILRNEIKARNIEYATLVGNDLRIIASANANRIGEKFDPSGLVSAVLKNPRQIKASGTVSWEELQRESPLLPEGFRDRDALIRYTATPVRAPNSDAIVGVLISGDIVNGKLSIVEDSLQAFEGGYSAIYLRQSKGKFVLASSLDQAEGEAEATRANIQLPDLSILERAAAAAGKPVTERIKIGMQVYAIAAIALPDANGEPTAILVRGTPEKSLNFLLRQSLVLQLVVAAIALVVNILLARILARAIAEPVKQLQQTTEKFALGNRQARAEVTAADEIGQLANTFNQLADNIVASEERLLEQAHYQEETAKRAQRLNEIILSVRRSLNQEEILNTAVRELRSAVNSDRAIVYLFDENWQGTIVAESVVPGYPVALGAMIADPCFAQGYVEKYKQGRVQATENIYSAGLTECHLNQLAAFEVKANIVAPIVVAGNLLGLLICHQCSGSRTWQESEIDLLRQVATLVGLTLEQVNLLEQREQARLQAEALFEEQRQQKEAIQMQLIDLLGHIEGVAQGDLTVRAEVTVGEIGTVADFFNSIVESLRQIVTKVKQSAVQVNSSLGENEGAMRLLAEVALQQAEETTRTLNSVEQMTQSIQAVAQSACQAAEVARSASLTAEEGEMAMDLTVENILSLRETVAQTAKKVKRLGEASQQISKVVSLINQIAMQTNLLAINAGIEAARAGEEGQGFAVVAEEVGALAARSASATQEIERIVEDIQRETAQVVEAMEQSTTQVVEGTKLVEGTKQSLGQILDVSRQIDQLVQSIFEATVSQVQTAQAVSSLMEEIAQVSEHTSNSSRNVSHSLRQTVEIAQQLQSSVGTFKVS